MKGFLRSRLVLTIAAFLMIAAAIAIPLSGNIMHTFAASRSSHNIAYVNYDDSGFTGSNIPSGNIFTDAVVGGPAPTSSPTASVTYNGMTFTPLARAALSTSSLANFDTLILFEVCDIATSLTNAQHTVINAFLAAGNKILLYDGDRCAKTQAGDANYSWFTFPFATSNPGPQGAGGTLDIVEKSTLTQGLASDPFNSDELGDANTATTSDPHWFAAAKTTNVLGNNGYFLAYARNKGLIIYDGADHWFTFGPTKSLTDLFLNELNQVYDPDNLPSTTPLASGTLFVFVQGINSGLGPKTDNPFYHADGIQPFLAKNYPQAAFLNFSYKGSDKATGLPLNYGCIDTFDNHLLFYVALLQIQLRRYLQANPSITNVYIIGHSMGGAVTFGYLALLDNSLHGLKGTIPGTNAHLKGIITLDSPLGGVEGGFNGLYEWLTLEFYYFKHCAGLQQAGHFSLDDLTNLFTKSTPIGGQASLYNLLFGVNRTNQNLAQEAHADGTNVLTTGNYDDYVFAPIECDIYATFLPGFRSTQFLKDQGNTSGIYGRQIVAGKFPCTTGPISPFKDLGNIGENHGDVLFNLSVKLGIQQFINGQPLTALAPPA